MPTGADKLLRYHREQYAPGCLVTVLAMAVPVHVGRWWCNSLPNGEVSERPPDYYTCMTTFAESNGRVLAWIPEAYLAGMDPRLDYTDPKGRFVVIRAAFLPEGYSYRGQGFGHLDNAILTGVYPWVEESHRIGRDGYARIAKPFYEDRLRWSVGPSQGDWPGVCDVCKGPAYVSNQFLECKAGCCPKRRHPGKQYDSV